MTNLKCGCRTSRASPRPWPIRTSADCGNCEPCGTRSSRGESYAAKVAALNAVLERMDAHARFLLEGRLAAMTRGDDPADRLVRCAVRVCPR
jgi:hypothetical protein